MIQRGWGQIRKSLSQYDFSSVQVNQKAREWCISPVSALSRLTALCKHDAFWLFQFKSKTLCKLRQKIKVFLSHICFTLSGQISKKAVKHICTTIFYTKINRKKGLSFKVYVSIVTSGKKKVGFNFKQNITTEILTWTFYWEICLLFHDYPSEISGSSQNHLCEYPDSKAEVQTFYQDDCQK